MAFFKADTGNFPTTEEGLEALINNPNTAKYKNYPNGGYLDSKSVPKDSWGKEYIYMLESNGFDIISLGSDGKEGGDAEGLDIYFSKCQE